MGTIRFGLFFSVFIAMVGLMIIAPVMPPLVRELGLSEIHSGLIISLGSVAMAVMSPLWGRWSDRYGRRPVIVAGFVGMFVSYVFFTGVAYAGLQDVLSGGLLLALLLAARTLIGVFIPAVPSSAQAYMADVTDERDRSAGMALIGAANGLGLVLGPAIAGVLALIGLIWPLYAGALLPLIAIAAVLLAVPNRKAAAIVRSPRIHPLQHGLRIYLLSGMAVMLCIVSLQVVGGFYFQDLLSLTTKETARFVSFGLMICGIAMIATQGLLMKRPQRDPRRTMLWGALLLVWSFALMLLFAKLTVFYAAYLFFGIGSGLMMTGFMTGASLAVSSDQQGGIAGLVGMVQGLAAVVAPLLSTGLYRIDVHLPYGLAAVLMLALSGTLLAVTLRRQNSITETQ